MNAQRAVQDPFEGGLPPEIEELAGAFALGAADADEAAAFLRALANPATAVRAAAVLAPYRGLAEALLYSAPAASAPPELGSRLLAAAAAEDVRAAAALGSAAGRAPAKPVFPAGAAERTRAGGRAWHWPGFWAVAAAGAIAVLLLLNLYWLRELGALRASHVALEQQLEDQTAELSTALAEQERMLQGQKEQLAAQDALLAQFVTSDSERYTMYAVQEGSSATAQVAWLDAANTAVLRAESFPPLEEGKAYQLWLIRGDERTSGGLFTVDEYGCATLVFHPTQSLDDFDGMGITPEPAVGSPGPTAPPIVRAQL